MQTLGHSGLRASGAPAPSLLEKAGWVDKLPLVVICGALLGFSSAAYGVWWLAWCGLAPLFLLIYGSNSRLEAMLTGLIYGLAYHMVALRWLLDLYPLDWLGLPSAAGYMVAGQAWVLESLHQALLFAVFAIFVYTLPMRSGFLPHYSRPFFSFLISVPFVWVFLQWVIAPSPFFLGVPIDQLAYSQSHTPSALQVAALGGAQLLDFLIVMANCALAALLMEFTGISRRLESRADIMSDPTGAIFDFGFMVAFLSIAFWWGRAEVLRDAAMPVYQEAPAAMTGTADAKTIALNQQRKFDFAPAIPVALVQSNIGIEQVQKNSPEQVSQQLLPLLSNLGAAVIVLPADTLDQPLRPYEPLRKQLGQTAREQKKDVIAGLREKSSAGVWDGVHIFSADKFNQDTDYMKFRLTPIAEYTPIGFLNALMPESLKKKITGGEDHVQATRVATLKSVFGRVGASIGAEIVYPDLILKQVTQGAALLVNVSDLSCFHNSMLGQELLAAGILRAVENGRYLVFVSNCGPSAVVDPHGVVTSTSLIRKQGVVLDRVQFLHRKTAFTRMCLWTPLYH